jgi:hypothetical protein
VEEIPEPISFPAIKAEPEEVNYCLCAHYSTHITNIHKCLVPFMISVSTSVPLNYSAMLNGNFSLFLACVIV